MRVTVVLSVVQFRILIFELKDVRQRLSARGHH